MDTHDIQFHFSWPNGWSVKSNKMGPNSSWAEAVEYTDCTSVLGKEKNLTHPMHVLDMTKNHMMLRL